MYPVPTNSLINTAVQLIPHEQELSNETIMKSNISRQTICSPQVHPSAAALRVTGNTFKRAISVKGLSSLLILAALVACTGKTGDPSTQAQTQTPTPPSAPSFFVACQGTTANPSTQPPAFVPLAPSSFLPNDGSVQAPPTAGLLGYNSFIPGSGGFPARGGTYVDPNFGGTVRRLTDTLGFRNQEDIYGHHWANANGSLAFSRTSAFNIINTTTGDEVYTNQPLGTVASDIAWDAIDPNRYYFYQGANLTCRNLVEQRNVVKIFPSTLEPNGGSLNTQDRSGRYFTVRYGGTNKLWDSQTDIIYSGEVQPLSSTGWVAITPDGNYLVTAAGPNKEHYSYAIDHTTQSISSTPVNFWTLCGDHGALVSAANGENYFITFDCDTSPGIYRVDITVPQTPLEVTKQHDDNLLLLPLAFTPVNTNEGHISAVSKEGPNQNWVFFDSETLGGDPFVLATITFVPFLPWQPYEQEIIAMNVVTSEMRRYAHHRSRGLSSSYYAQPRISCSWDGSIILWTSNYNTSSPTGYADMYGMAFSN